MMVCDICMSSEKLAKTQANAVRPGSSYQTPVWNPTADFCPTCLEALQKKDFRILADRQKHTILALAGLSYLEQPDDQNEGDTPDASQPTQ